MLEIDDQLVFNGFHDAAIYHNQPITGLRASDVKTVFGDTSGVIGALTHAGGVWRLVGRGAGLGLLECGGVEGGWLLGKGGGEGRVIIDQVAVAENGQVCVVTCSLPVFLYFLLVFSLTLPTNIVLLNVQIQTPQPHPHAHPHPPTPHPA